MYTYTYTYTYTYCKSQIYSGPFIIANFAYSTIREINGTSFIHVHVHVRIRVRSLYMYLKAGTSLIQLKSPNKRDSIIMGFTVHMHIHVHIHLFVYTVSALHSGVKKGFLHKKKKVDNVWQSRFFVLEGDNLRYYRKLSVIICNTVHVHMYL